MEDRSSDKQPKDLTKEPAKLAPVNPDRLSLPFPVRLTYGVLGGFATGMFLGLSHGSKTSGLQFRAENAHRLPTSQKGWYLYHKSKNYHMMLGGLKEGFKLAPKISLWAGGLFMIEHIVDRGRSRSADSLWEYRQGREDFLSTTVATLTLAGIFSFWHKLPLPTAARTARMGLYSGLAFGLLQDLAGLARGRRLAYVDFLMGRKPDAVENKEHTANAISYKTTS